MAAIDPALMEAAGFTGAGAQQRVGSAQAQAAVNTNQNNLAGEQARTGITDSAESRGMLRSSITNRDLGQQTAEQANRQNLIDLGVSDTLANANIDVMQELARQQAQQMQISNTISQAEAQTPTIDWAALAARGITPNSTTGGNPLWSGQ
jgi:hypothetical protein